MSPSFAGKNADIESPSRRFHSWVVYNLESRIKRYPQKASNLKGLSREKAFFDNNKQHFGTVYAASGYTRKTKKNCRLDWALIKPSSTGIARIGVNNLRPN
ncbi:hypothetical protein QBC47DRAFT_402030 [Echria macrotheca]|uniref:Uncharacterized protein n=1 Tax=Echria macrotheca TaxID=438768 RepID=A0AAJ0BD72_9PEZI|nr:hypothetical protein QBC47DRAFT_402030 [Echria macrotheca]